MIHGWRTLAPSRDPLLPAFKPDKSSIKAVMPRKRISRKAAKSAQLDGDKKGMGGYKSKMRMDDMPVDWIEQVISFLSLTDVYKCRSVCMAWHVAADRVLSDWDILELAYGSGSHCGDAPHQISILLDKAAVLTDRQDRGHPIDAETWIKRLKPLVRLKKIFLTGNYLWSEPRAVVNDVVLRNASTLTTLHMGLGATAI